jgi:hypothetical protein
MLFAFNVSLFQKSLAATFREFKKVGPEKRLIPFMVNVLGTILAVLDCR